MTIDNVTDGSKADGFIIPAGSMFPFGCTIPNNTASLSIYPSQVETS